MTPSLCCAPAGADVEFNYVTFTGYADLDGGLDDKLAPAVLDKAEQQKLRKAEDLRTTVARETWIPVLHVLPSRS